MRSRVTKWGNSLGLRIPRALAEATGVAEGTEVSLAVVRGSLVVRPEPPRRIALDVLLRRVTPRNRHGEVDAGGPVGREA